MPAPRALTLVLFLLGCGASGPPPSWPARPFHGERREVPDVARAAYDEAYDRLASDLGPYVVEGGVLVEGTVSSSSGRWPVRGVLARGEGWGELELRFASDRLSYASAEWGDGSCTFSASWTASYGPCDPAVLEQDVFDVEVGQPPDVELVHVELRRASEVCPGWMLDAVRAPLATRPGFRDEGGRWSWGVGDDVVGRLVSSDGGQCCWETAAWSARAWIERSCPGAYGIDVDVDEPSTTCGACATPPRGCGG